MADQDASAITSPSNTKWGPAVEERFLEEFRQTGRWYDSAHAAGVAYRTVRIRVKPDEPEYDPEFVAKVEEALECYRDLVRAEIRRRGIEGWVERPIFNNLGEHVGDVRKYSDRLLELEAKKHDKDYTDRVAVDARAQVEAAVAVKVEVDLSVLDKAGRKALRKVCQQLIAAGAGRGGQDAPEVH